VSPAVKICGLSSQPALDAAIAGGARFVGFVFYPPSPRNLTPEAAGALAQEVPPGITKVGVFVDPDDALLSAVLAAATLDLLQLHGTEGPERVAEIRRRFGVPTMKAIAVAGPDDLDAAPRYLDVADWLLFDAKPPRDAAGALPGGNGLALDWQLLRARRWPLPWMLSGGLDAANLAEAVRISGAPNIDVSSGVEVRPGVKDPVKIAAFLTAARHL
jgi:phosphoribosylanthranilate isomerase